MSERPIELIEPDSECGQIAEYCAILRHEIARAFTVPSHLLMTPEQYERFKTQAHHKTEAMRAERLRIEMTNARPPRALIGKGMVRI